MVSNPLPDVARYLQLFFHGGARPRGGSAGSQLDSIYGFAAPAPNSLWLPVPEYLSKPMKETPR